MRKLKFLIEIPDWMSHGLFSPGRGESRWAQNLAHFLSKRGHEVTAYTSHPVCQWGNYPPQSGLSIIQERHIPRTAEFDVIINNTFWEGHSPPPWKHKLFLLGKYGHEKWTETIPDNWWVITPYDVPWVATHGKCVWLPAPYFEQFGASKFNNKDVIIPARNIATRQDIMTRAAATLVQSAVLLQPELKYSVWWICADFLLGDQKEYEAAKKHNIYDLAQSLKNNKIYKQIDWGSVLQIFNQYTKLNLTCAGPTNVIDSVMMGVPALIYNNNTFTFLNNVEGIQLKSSTEEVQHYIKKLWYDESFYNRILEQERESIKDLQAGPAMDKFESFVYSVL